MADDPTNPINQHGVPLYGPLTDHVNAALKATNDAEHAHFQATGRLDPERYKTAMRKARENAKAEWHKENSNG